MTYATVERRTLRAEPPRGGQRGSRTEKRWRYWEFVARTDGYVKKLFVTSPGENGGEPTSPLLSFYSPDLFHGGTRVRDAARGARRVRPGVRTGDA